ncbi:uncharacterized protein [Triticum aestivum]|uniref:uncharacterized protein n=1 Tax=Triticum aestivum TaxID=4565 RepID=UPI001D00E980|nr:uncharacterized protein LOC123039140 [Triticum aestivum]
MLEELVDNSSIINEHRTLMSAIMQGVWFVQSGLTDAVQGLLTGFEASSMATAANVAALEEMDPKLKLSDKELDLVNKRLDEVQAKPSAAADVEGLREALKKVEAEADAKKTAAEKAVAELEKAKLAAEQHEARVTEVQVELQDATEKLEALEKGQEEQSSRLSKAEKFSLLTRVWRSAGVFVELPKNVAAAARYYATVEEDSMQRLFWSQCLDFECPPLLSDQMKQLMEMHRMSKLAVKDLCKMREAPLWIDAVKRSACLEGPRLAFAKTMEIERESDPTVSRDLSIYSLRPEIHVAAVILQFSPQPSPDRTRSPSAWSLSSSFLSDRPAPPTPFPSAQLHAACASSPSPAVPLPPQRRRPLPCARYRRSLPLACPSASVKNRFSPSGSSICSGRAQSAAETTNTARQSYFCRSPARGCCCLSSAAAAGWWRRAPTCSSIRSRTPPPSTPTSRHMMCTLGRPVRRTANETTPNVMSVLTFCNQATALLRSPPAAAKESAEEEQQQQHGHGRSRRQGRITGDSRAPPAGARGEAAVGAREEAATGAQGEATGGARGRAGEQFWAEARILAAAHVWAAAAEQLGGNASLGDGRGSRRRRRRP